MNDIERAQRQAALDFAVRSQRPIETVTEVRARAEVFYAFLSGAEVKGTTKKKRK